MLRALRRRAHRRRLQPNADVGRPDPGERCRRSNPRDSATVAALTEEVLSRLLIQWRSCLEVATDLEASDDRRSRTHTLEPCSDKGELRDLESEPIVDAEPGENRHVGNRIL